jgi:hypothetical protein
VTESSLIDEVEGVLHRHDPIGINVWDDPGEYRPDAETIVARLPHARSADDVRTLVHEEFVRWFGNLARAPDRDDLLPRPATFALKAAYGTQRTRQQPRWTNVRMWPRRIAPTSRRWR